MISKKQSTFILLALAMYIIYKVFQNGIPIVYSWDLFGSYIYLPMLFDQHQFSYTDFSYFEAINKEHELSTTLYQFVLNENGKIMTKYTLGWSILMSPFYLIAECWAWIAGYKTDGFSFPYKIMIVVGNLSYFVLALFQLRKLFKRYFSESLSLILILLLFLGTNILFSQYASLGSTHLIEFLLIILFINQSFTFYEKISFKSGIYLGILLALIFLVRPPDIVLALIPILWKNEQFPNLKSKIIYFWKEKRSLLISILSIFIILISLQFCYWKITAGSFLINSYANNAGEGFDWFTPYFYQVLFSFRKGWLIYTPLVVFCFIGFYFWLKKDKNASSFLIPFLVFFYIISCWTTWWYASSFSQRAVLEIYPLLFIAFGFFLQKISQNKVKYIVYPLILLLVLFNLFQTYQIENGVLKTDHMTKSYYFSVFGQTSYPSEKQMNLLSIDRDKIYLEDIDKNTNYLKSKTMFFDFNPPAMLNKDSIYTPVIQYNQKELSLKDHFWIKVKWTYEGNTGALNGKIFNAASFYKNKSYAWAGNDISQKEFQVDTIKHEVYFQYLSPNFRSKNDFIRIGVWNQSGEPISFTKAEISIYEAKITYE